MEATSGLDGVLFQSFRYRRRNLAKNAAAVGAWYRWDAQKRRIFAEFSAPLDGYPRMHYRLYSDARSETWNLGTPGDFRLQKIEAGGSLRQTPSERLFWELGARLADRRFTENTRFDSGFTVASSVAAGYRLLNMPERALTIDASGDMQLGRFFSSAGGIYSRAQASLQGHWRPDTRSKYEAAINIRLGRVFGPAPFDELFSLGRERDDALGLRGYHGTRSGKKGLAPTGGQYVAASLDFFREIWKGPLATWT